MGAGKLRKPKKAKTIRGHLIAGNLVVIVLAIISIEISLTAILVRSLIADSAEGNAELVRTMSNSFDDMWNAFKWTINSITMDETFQKVLAGADGVQYENGEDNAILLSIMSDASLYCDEMDKVCVYDADGVQKVILNRIRSGGTFDLYPELHTDWFDESGKITTHMMDGSLVFSRIIYDRSSFRRIGYILCVYNQSALEKRINTVTPSSSRFVAVIDASGDVVAHNYPDQGFLSTVVESLDTDGTQTTSAFWMDGLGMVLATQRGSSITGWRTISVISLSEVLYAYVDTFIIIAALGVFAILLCFAVQYSQAKRITKPLSAIVNSITQAESGNYSDCVSADTGDEIEVLAEAYNGLMRKTDTLVNKVLKGEIAYRNAQLEALQSQINPHLLFNTLECINWLAENERKEDVRAVTTAFSRLMKAMMSKPHNTTLAQELELTENFLMIYKILLGNSFSYSIQAEDVPLDTMLPQLTIQPIVENAVLHGVKVQGGGTVNVIAAETPEGVMISVLDDGAGIDEQRLRAINAYACGQADEQQKKLVGIGLSNVVDRLRLLYRGQACVEVSSSSDWGTMVRIILPARQENHEENNTNAERRRTPTWVP